MIDDIEDWMEPNENIEEVIEYWIRLSLKIIININKPLV